MLATSYLAHRELFRMVFVKEQIMKLRLATLSADLIGRQQMDDGYIENAIHYLRDHAENLRVFETVVSDWVANIGTQAYPGCSFKNIANVASNDDWKSELAAAFEREMTDNA